MTDGPLPSAVLDLPRHQIPRPLVRGDFDLRPYTDSSNSRGAWQVLNTLVPLALLWGLAFRALSNGSWLLVPLMAL